ncbi:Fe2+-dependent dioxygenase [Novosphingobium mangrovi (ex Hu et al. 2023)]|uniref:Fe2+-dependent dioxygenase n=1 Tax=Novosphingobium mangrovi (ex Hu et al. 2023) TaxID=2930094 RepID=A0ABT0AF79_9SPHN|nr:Fe2+-dependent dioxygenase [Novosphingobium mangrovi (ex Hu et al. 2023)]MCJ1961847.1 Fe2+-dependent dioxygenase [Novosphingobium mangrovi (ex Hu et al. 2023)]
MLIVIENLLGPDEVADLRARLNDARWIDGNQTAGTRSIAVKQNLQVDRECPVGRELSNILLRRLGETPRFVSASLAEKIWPPVFNAYQDGGHYGTHVDSALMRDNARGLTLRSDLSATIFLSDPDSYEGGELVIEQEYGAQGVKLAAGDMVLYPSSSLHQVTPVTSGQRLCAILWLQSAVADAAERALLYDLDQSIQALSSDRAVDDPDVDRLIHVYHNLVRRWAQV